MAQEKMQGNRGEGQAARQKVRGEGGVPDAGEGARGDAFEAPANGTEKGQKRAKLLRRSLGAVLLVLLLSSPWSFPAIFDALGDSDEAERSNPWFEKELQAVNMLHQIRLKRHERLAEQELTLSVTEPVEEAEPPNFDEFIHGLSPEPAPEHLGKHLRFQIVGYRLADPLNVTFRKDESRPFVSGGEGLIQIVEGSGAASSQPFYSILSRSDEAMVRAGATPGEVQKFRDLIAKVAELDARVAEDESALPEVEAAFAELEELELELNGVFDLAFHPDFPQDPRFFIVISQQEEPLLLEYSLNPENLWQVDYDSERIVLKLPRQTGKVGNWQLKFGPDRRLYLGVPAALESSLEDEYPMSEYWGTLLALDLRHPEKKPQVVVRGLNQIRRFSFDPLDERLFLSDTGTYVQELSVLEASEWKKGDIPMGYPKYEGSACIVESCDEAQDAHRRPDFEYGLKTGCGIVGGMVYRGKQFPELNGHYFFSDACQGFVRSLRVEDGKVSEYYDWSDWVDTPRDFGLQMGWSADAEGEPYVALMSGVLLKMIRVDSAPRRFVPPEVLPTWRDTSGFHLK